MAINRFKRSYTQNGRSKKSSAPPPITGESDWRALYKRRRMPARRRRPWIKFSRKVRHILGKQIAPNFNVRVYEETLGGAANEQQVSASHTIMGAEGTNPHTDDAKYLIQIAIDNGIITGPGTPAAATGDQLRFIVSGWICETMITNLETYPIFVDMYYWRCKRDIPASTIPSISALFSESLSDLRPNITTSLSNTTLTANDYGVTPFQGTQFAKSVQIWKKNRVKLAGGSVTQIETRSSRDMVVNWGFAEHYSMLRNVTQGVFFIVYGSPDSTDLVARSASCQIVTNKNFTWRMLLDNRQQGMHTVT